MSIAEEMPAELLAEARAAYSAKVTRMQEHLAAQPKVKVMVPRGNGADWVFIVNGVRFDLQPGAVAEVPEQIAAMVHERIRTDGNVRCHGNPHDCADSPGGNHVS